MRQNPVGEPAATAARNFATPLRRSSLKRLGPFFYCRQRYMRNLRRILASRLVSTRKVWQKPKSGLADAMLSYVLCCPLRHGQFASRLPQFQQWNMAQASPGKFDRLRRTPTEFTALALDGCGLRDQ